MSGKRRVTYFYEPNVGNFHYGRFYILKYNILYTIDYDFLD